MLKRTAAAAVMLACAPLANAEPFCDKAAQLARASMELRQAGYPIDEVLSALKSKSQKNYELGEPLIIRAYERPLANGKSDKEKAVVDFGDDAYLSCRKMK